MRSTLASDTLLSTLRCAGVLSRLAGLHQLAPRRCPPHARRSARHGGPRGEFFTHRVMHFASSLRGTSQFWFKQRSRLISMVDTLGMPTVFFTHSAADGQWPELARLICPDKKDSSSSHSKAVSDNPAIADWFFYHRISKFVDTFYTDVMGAVDFWYRFEWQHRGSPHVHGIAWFADVQHLLAAEDYSDLIGGVENVTSYADSIVSTINPVILTDGSNAENAPLPQALLRGGRHQDGPD